MAKSNEPISKEERAKRSFKELISTTRLVCRRDTGGLSAKEYHSYLKDKMDNLSSDEKVNFAKSLINKRRLGIKEAQSHSLNEMSRRIELMGEILKILRADFPPRSLPVSDRKLLIDRLWYLLKPNGH
jgi:hypothetical protein